MPRTNYNPIVKQASPSSTRNGSPNSMNSDGSPTRPVPPGVYRQWDPKNNHQVVVTSQGQNNVYYDPSRQPRTNSAEQRLGNYIGAGRATRGETR